MQSLSTLLEHALNIAYQAGEQLKTFYQHKVNIKIKADHTPVTEADLAVSRYLVQALQQIDPSIPVLSEENCAIPLAERQKWQRYWLIDPLDGTQQFIDRTDQFSVLIALIEEQHPIIGIIHAPVLNQTFYAVKGQGAFFRQNQQLQPLNSRHPFDPQKPITIAIGKSNNQQKVLSVLNPKFNYQFITYGSSGLKSTLVARQQCDCYIRLGDTGEWDTAAAQLILQESGGDIFTLSQQPLTYNQRDTFVNPHFIVVGDRHWDWRQILLQQ
ncbi:3'-5'-bisphosphate nucleotidase [Gallibacterium genomosp. 3]|uniref:3'(2'),5'-bisphosphate nucleotidase CysQ n=1 Tax=Gallibacterium genomosp. 3 TaxID=505345 RepID=A0A1A7NTF7_9PAST|nr:3'(2'),5'-bisphosphate nucleotidase CysQ [Gallibacterium genomosp. 3]OBW92791.1 3'-5'-bisphosphate nucleotidase [Gallibacterium genomosp. 3]